ncbi:MAG: Uma2 family endonuclease [Lawsonibacter sp.]|nr:Uma2 family endonuclease [Lawsonibacter sp.]
MNSNLAYQDELRGELINGEVVAMSSSPTFNHNRVASRIYRAFENYLEGKRCTAIADGTDLYLTQEDRLIPDMMVVCDRDKIRRDGVHGAPDLVVEVLSPSTARNDRMHKKAVYEASGVREYWLVDPENRTMEQHFLRDGRLELNTVYTSYPESELERMTEKERAEVETHFKCSLYDDFAIALDDIFSGLLP